MVNRHLSAVVLIAVVGCTTTSVPPTSTLPTSASDRQLGPNLPSVLEFVSPVGALRVVTDHPQTSTGTMRYADRVVVELGAKTPFIRSTDVETGVVAPLFEQIHPISDSSMLLLGWSAGSGANTLVHAWLVEVSDEAVMLIDDLVVNAEAWRPGIIVSPEEPTKVGVLLPNCTHHDDCVLDNAGVGSSLSSRVLRVDLSAVRQLLPLAAVDTRDAYRPRRPSQLDNQAMGVMWFAIVDSTFVPSVTAP
jgi:hypothetical protein